MCDMTAIREKMSKLTIWDFAIMKISLIAFTLMVAKILPVVLVLEWGWYAAVFAVSYLYLAYLFIIRK